MKLYGKDLDDELARREKIQEDRRIKRLTIREASKQMGIKPSEYSDWERGVDVCPHEEFEDMCGGFPVPKLIFKQCKKCHYVEPESIKKVTNENMERVYEVYKRIYGQKR